MRHITLRSFLILLGLTQISLFCGTDPQTQKTPPIMLWAWERNEDLRFIDPAKTGVAYLAQTLIFSGDQFTLSPRRQPLKIKPGTYLIAVTRIETSRDNKAFSGTQLNEAAELIANSSLRRDVRGVQIDFDARVSERGSYLKLLDRVRAGLSPDKTLSITALASFCIGDRWMTDLPIDEAVPMLFEMGADRRQIAAYLKSGKDFSEPLCRMSYGLAVYEHRHINFKQTRTRYYFDSKVWKPGTLEKLK